MSYAAFEAEVARVNDILCAVNLLVWDSRTMMPPGGSRGARQADWARWSKSRAGSPPATPC